MASAIGDQTTDLKVTGTAVGRPDDSPAGSTVSTADWPSAQISYLDVTGRQTNTANKPSVARRLLIGEELHRHRRNRPNGGP